MQIRSPDLNGCPMAFTGCDQLIADLGTILRGWDIRKDCASLQPAVVRLKRTRRGYLRISRWSKTLSKCRATFRTHHTDALFGVHYDLLRWYVEAQRSRPCLHSAAVKFASGLVVFPNTTKAGKTTLAIQLAIAGHQVFGDDWLPIHQPGNLGMALGILPWLRLPAPAGVREDFSRFLKNRQGPRNRRWAYVNLRDDELSPHGATAPVSGLVLLGRRGSGRARLAPVTKDRMLTELIKQNYARQVPSIDIFDTLRALTENAECFSLKYASVREAVSLLQDVFGGPNQAGSDRIGYGRDGLDRNAETYRRASGVIKRKVGRTTYLVHVRRDTIHQLNPVGAAIWAQLAAPARYGDLAQALQLEFPDIDRGVIERDLGALFDGLLEAELIVRL